MSAIEIRAVRKTYGAMPVLHGIDLDIKAGEFVVLVGPSGCGKSTLLRTIAGLEDLSSGEIRIGGKVVSDLPPRERDIAMVFQSYALYPHMSVAGNMGYSLRLRRTPRDRIAQAIAGAASKLGLDQLLERKPRALSGGQRQRVAMGRAIVRRPQAFLFDEPLSNLDARLREQMRGEIKKLHRELGATSIYVTHDQIEAMTLADRIVSMNGGVIQQVGTPLELYDRPANLFVAGFIGSPAMNMIEGRYALTQAGPAVALADHETVGLAGPLPVTEGTSVTLGIRPEHVTLAVPGAGAIAGTVELVEPTGLGVIVHAVVGTRGAGGADIKLFTLARPVLAIGDRVALDLPAQHLHLFDRETGNRIAA